MKNFRSIVVLRRPIDEMWSIMRDYMGSLIDRLPDIERILELERVSESDGQTRLVNAWYIRQQIPPMLLDLLGTAELGWIDRSVWEPRNRTCAWTVEPFVLQESVSCRGATRFEQAIGGRGTRVTFEGVIELELGALNLSRILEGPVTRFLESILTTVVPRNLRSILEAAAAFQVSPE